MLGTLHKSFIFLLMLKAFGNKDASAFVNRKSIRRGDLLNTYGIRAVLLCFALLCSFLEPIALNRGVLPEKSGHGVGIMTMSYAVQYQLITRQHV